MDYVDVAASEDAKAEMREKVGNPSALPPQFVHRQNGYLGDYEKFEGAIEDDDLFGFLKWSP